jgi:hypothetical protein
MSFGNYSKQAPQCAVTRPCVLRGLRNPDGSNPVVHVEFLGRENKPYWLELLAKTQAKAQTASSVASPAELDRKGRDEIAENRETVIKHSARRLEHVFRDDGTAANEKDIAGFVRSIPDEDFEYLFGFALTAANFRDYAITGDPQAIAEK